MEKENNVIAVVNHDEEYGFVTPLTSNQVGTLKKLVAMDRSNNPESIVLYEDEQSIKDEMNRLAYDMAGLAQTLKVTFNLRRENEHSRGIEEAELLGIDTTLRCVEGYSAKIRRLLNALWMFEQDRQDKREAAGGEV